MAKIVTITNPLTGQPAQVDQLDHTAQQIDDGLNIARGVSNPNLLDNWYFGNPVNQRGQTEYTESGYTFDRWLLYEWNTTSKACSVATNGLRVYGEASSSCSTSIKQFVEGLKAGCQVTASVLVTNFTAGAAVCLFIRTNSGVKLAYVRFSKPGLYSVTTTLPDDFDGNLMIEIGQGGSDGGNGNTDFTVLAIKLELGSQQTLAHQDADGNWVLNEIPDYGEQLAKCQRYYLSNKQRNAYGKSVSANTAYTDIPTPVTMRALPVIETGVIGNIICNGVKATIASINPGKLNDESITLQLVLNTSVSVDYPVFLTDTKYALSADLL